MLAKKIKFWLLFFLIFNCVQNGFAQNENFIIQQNNLEKITPFKSPDIIVEHEKNNQNEFLLIGTVTCELTKEPLIQASIVVKGTTNGTTTDEYGYFALKNIKENDILVFSCAGYTPLEQKIEKKHREKITILMEETIFSRNVIICGERPNIFLRTWRGIKSIFRRKRD